MESLRQYLMGLPVEELLKKQPSDVLVLMSHTYAYAGLTPPPQEEVNNLFFDVLKDHANVTGACIYNPRDRTYLSSGLDLRLTEDKDKALVIPIDEAVEFKKTLIKLKILTRLEYVTG